MKPLPGQSSRLPPMDPSALTDRQLFALRWLFENTDSAPKPRDNDWQVPPRTEYSFSLAASLVKEGMVTVGKTRDHWNVNGAANTLVALKRRGLAANDGGGIFIQNQWWITPAGVAVVLGED